MHTVEKANQFIQKNKHKLDDTYKPKYHLSSELGWLNDPNGFSYFKGKYHLFFQYYPYQAEWGPIHWGHATTKDFIHWKHELVALAPDQPYDLAGCFSGSAIEKDGTLYLMYTGHQHPDLKNPTKIRQVQCIAKSDDGIQFKKNNQNPVIDTKDIPENASIHDFRDPKIFKRHNRYYSIIGSLDKNGDGQILLYQSNDLINWSYLSPLLKNQPIGTMWECPDLIHLNNQDVLLMSPQFINSEPYRFTNLHGALYMIGNFNEAMGSYDYNKMDEIDKGFDFYAPQTMTSPDGRTIMVAWMQMWESPMPTKTHDWAGSMTFPRELSIKDDILYQWPVKEIEKTYKNTVTHSNVLIDKECQLEHIAGRVVDIELDVDLTHAKLFSIDLYKCDTYKTTLTYDVKEAMLTFSRDDSGIGPKGVKRFPLKIKGNTLNIRFLLDVSLVEIFFEKGKYALSSTVYPTPKANKIVFNTKGKSLITYIKKHDLDV